MDRNRITPDNIRELAPNEIFVFGSNLQGWHGGGAARIAVDKFGAIEGLGVGPQGQCYAIPTIQRKSGISRDKNWLRYCWFHC